MLLSNGANIEAETDENWTALHIACQNNDNYGIVKMLLERDANIEAKTKNGMTPILVAVTNNSLDIVKLLVEKGADTSVKDNYKEGIYNKTKTTEMVKLLKTLGIK